jgi:hypothetical protein
MEGLKDALHAPIYPFALPCPSKTPPRRYFFLLILSFFLLLRILTPSLCSFHHSVSPVVAGGRPDSSGREVRVRVPPSGEVVHST